MPDQLPESVRARLRPAAPLSAVVPDEYERPVADLIKPAAEIEGEPLASLVGVPFDTSILGRRGAKSGPPAVRTALGGCLCYEPGIEVDLAGAPRVADYGDVDVVHTHVDETWERVSEVIEALTRLGRPLVTIGGDHGLTFPVVRGVCRAVGGRVGLISVDAHFDVRISHHGEKGSGVPFRYILEELGDSIRGESFVEFGVGGWLNTKLYHDYLREKGSRIITAREIWRGDAVELFGEALEQAAEGTDALYLTFDIDAVDGAVVGGTNVPAIGGLNPFEAMEIVWQFANHPCAVAIDVMEVSPAWDHSGLSERMAASLILNFLAGRYVVAQRRGQTAGTAAAAR